MADLAASAANQSMKPSESGSGAPTPNKPTYSKRGKITIVACVPCRKRKTKCDGRRPSCSQCMSRDSQCQYDMNEEQRRLTFLRENAGKVAEEKSVLESFLWHLRGSTESEAIEILRRYRGGVDEQSLLQQIQASRSLTEVKGDKGGFAYGGSSSQYYGGSMHNTYQSAVEASQLSRADTYEHIIQALATKPARQSGEILERLRRKEPIERIVESIDAPRPSTDLSLMNLDQPQPDPAATLVFHARPMAGNVLAPQLTPTFRGPRDDEVHTPLTTAEDYRWTTVSEDKEFIEHLLEVYFMWQHNFFQNFPEALFRQDYDAGRTRYCSRVLVNAICAASCLLSDRPEARGDPNDPSTAGSGFFEEGMILLNRSDRSSLPTTAAIFILSHVEGYRARMNKYWGLVGRSARMALDLNLHLRNDRMAYEDMSPEMQKTENARIHCFWGCFISDQITSLTLGRLPQILTNAITVELPPHVPEEDENPWGPSHGPSYRRPGARAMTFRQCASLSKIVNSTLLMFFAPSQIIKGSLILNEYEKYLYWKKKLPANVSSVDSAPAHVLSLHIYYHAAVLLLFRPFIHAKFTDSPDIAPADICRQCATAISDLFAKHMSLYGATGIYTFQIQSLLSACTIHLINLPAIAASSSLTAACNAFFHLVTRNTWAYGSIRLIRDLVKKWKLILPGDVEFALYPPNEDIPPGITSRFDDPTTTASNIRRDSNSSTTSAATSSVASKRTLFLNPSSQMLPKRQKLAPVTSTKSPTGTMDNSSGEETPESHTHLARDDHQGRSILFAPFPNQPAPLLGPVHTSITPDSDLNDEDMMRKVTQDFDGLRFEGDGWFDPFL